MKHLVINSLDYFPAISFIRIIKNIDQLSFNFNEKFDKTLHNNRCQILSSQGVLKISIPLAGGRNQKATFENVKILDDYKWKFNHWQSLESCYGKSPFFLYYKDDLKSVFFKDYIFLKDINLALLKWVLKKLKINITIQIDNEVSISPYKILEAYLPKKYIQVFENKIGFIQNCSIADLLFNTGTQAIHYL